MRDYRLRLADIAECCEKISRYTAGMNIDQFEIDEKTFDAVVRNLEIIGEASNHIAPQIRNLHPDVEWRKIIALRNIVVHAYFGVDIDIIWDLVENKVPELLDQIRHILSLEQDNEEES